MAAMKPKKYFANSTGRITLRKPSPWDDRQHASGRARYFDTWAAAHAHLLERSFKDLHHAQRGLKSAANRLERLTAMRDPTIGETPQ